MKKSEKLYYQLIVLVLISPIFLYILLQLFRWGIHHHNLQFLIIGSVDGWISYFGIVVGSLITIFTVIDAIERDKDSRLKDKIKAAQPYLFVNPTMDNDGGIKQKFFKKKDDVPVYPLNFDISNLSNNAAKDLKLKSTTISEIRMLDNGDLTYFDISDNVDSIQCMFVPLDKDNKFIPPDGHDCYVMNCFVNSDECTSTGILVELILEYSDIFDLATYSHKFEIELNLGFFFNGDLTFTLDSSKNTIVKVE